MRVAKNGRTVDVCSDVVTGEQSDNAAMGQVSSRKIKRVSNDAKMQHVLHMSLSGGFGLLVLKVVC
ncbi:MAG: hypothetical protein JJ866_23530 [Roseibium sp.]|uniref:hypothetical protein n=1 Tax=Roseibium sp. TaxID=1936156 RepID=UPI001B20CA5A|nr:hypothetical protein [Roseibium sp.]MBO6894929.1 hypothetical protein [Roseibium sp.]MBO6930819.1 hypothetical protein [Roseibium sp.]